MLLVNLLLMSLFFYVIDVDECIIGEVICYVNVFCLNMIGLYVCRCIRGYEGDGRICRG